MTLKKMGLTNFPNGIQTFLVDNNGVEKIAAYTVVITTDSGKTLVSKTDGVVFTLPAIAIGNTVTFVNTGQDGQNTLTVSPNANDSITYAGTAVDDKDIINTKVTSKKGDFITLASLDGVISWQVVAVRGIWAKE